MISLEALEAALAPLTALSGGEATFDVGATPITLRVLSTDEEIDVQKYASLPINLVDDAEEGKSQTVALEYIERFKIGILAHSIVRIGLTDLHDVKFVETTEKLGNGTSVKIPKPKVVRDFLTQLPGGSQIVGRLYRKYHELLSKVEKDAEKAIVFEPTDMDAEIERLETRLLALKSEKERTDSPPSGGLTEQIKRVAALEEPPTEGVSVPSPVIPQQPQKRQPIIPGQGAAPVSGTTPAPHPQPPPPAPVQPAEDEIEDSFVDTGDPDAMAGAIARENARIRARRAGMAPPTPEPESALSAVHETIRRPQVTTNPALSGVKQAAIAAAQQSETEQATLVGKNDQGVETYRMPAQELATVPIPNPDARPVPLNRTGEGLGRNPRFRPANR